MYGPATRRDRNTPAPTRFVRAPAETSTGAELLDAAQAIERAQQATVEAAPTEQTYEEALAVYVQAKFAQVEHIEDRLEQLVDRQQARLQQTATAKPGFLARPATRQAWQRQQVQQQARLQVLHTRLELVRELKEGAGLHAPRLEEMATRKMRAECPALASDWDAMREAARRHDAHMRQQERERKQTQRTGRTQTLGGINDL